MSEQICSTLAERIYNGSLPPGERLIELQIAKEFETSQTPVREALRILETKALVETEAYRGTRVRQVSPREMAEAYCVRGALEQLAAELIGNQLKGNVSTLREAAEGIKVAAHANDVEGYTQQNLTFHRAIVWASGNAVLLKSWEALEFETRMRINVDRASTRDLVSRIQIHFDIADAFDEGNGRKAGKLLREHAQEFGDSWKTDTEDDQTSPSPSRGSGRRKVR